MSDLCSLLEARRIQRAEVVAAIPEEAVEAAAATQCRVIGGGVADP